MKVWNLSVLLLGAVVRGFSISTSTVDGEMVVNALGTSTHVMNEQEKETFGIDDEEMRDSLNADGFKYPFVSTNPDLLEIFFPTVDPLLTKVSAISSGFTQGAANPDIVFSTVMTNTGPVASTLEQVVSKEETQTVTHEWSQSETFDVSQEISVSINLGPLASGSSTTTLSYGQEWGSTESFSQSVTLGSEFSVSLTLQPGQEVQITMISFKGIAEVDVNFEASVAGNVCYMSCITTASGLCSPSFYKHSPFEELFGGSEFDQTHQISEKLRFEYFSNTYIEISEVIPPALRGKENEIVLRRKSDTPAAYTENGIPIFDDAGVLNA